MKIRVERLFTSIAYVDLASYPGMNAEQAMAYEKNLDTAEVLEFLVESTDISIITNCEIVP